MTAASPYTVAFDLPDAPAGYPVLGTEGIRFGCTVDPCGSDWEGNLETGHTGFPPNGFTLNLGTAPGLRDVGVFDGASLDYTRDRRMEISSYQPIVFPSGLDTLYITFLLTGVYTDTTFYRVDYARLDVRWGEDGESWWGGTTVLFGTPPVPPVTPVPLPAGAWLMLAALGGIGLAGRRGRRP